MSDSRPNFLAEANATSDWTCLTPQRINNFPLCPSVQSLILPKKLALKAKGKNAAGIVNVNSRIGGKNSKYELGGKNEKFRELWKEIWRWEETYKKRSYFCFLQLKTDAVEYQIIKKKKKLIHLNSEKRYFNIKNKNFKNG